MFEATVVGICYKTLPMRSGIPSVQWASQHLNHTIASSPYLFWWNPWNSMGLSASCQAKMTTRTVIQTKLLGTHHALTEQPKQRKLNKDMKSREHPSAVGIWSIRATRRQNPNVSTDFWLTKANDRRSWRCRNWLRSRCGPKPPKQLT